MINKVIVQGRHTKDPELQQKGGFDMCEFTIAWSEKYKERETKCFLRCKAWRDQANHIVKYYHKGQECVVEGRLETEEWEKDGMNQRRTVCNVEKIHFCGPKHNATSTDTVKSSGDEDFMKIDPKIDEELPFN